LTSYTVTTCTLGLQYRKRTACCVAAVALAELAAVTGTHSLPAAAAAAAASTAAAAAVSAAAGNLEEDQRAWLHELMDHHHVLCQS